MSKGKLEATTRGQGQPDLSVLAAFVWEKPLRYREFWRKIPNLAMGTRAGRMILFHKKECPEPQ